MMMMKKKRKRKMGCIFFDSFSMELKTKVLRKRFATSMSRCFCWLRLQL